MVEVLSGGTTAAETSAKREVYWRAEVRVIWYIDPSSRDAMCHSVGHESILDAPDEFLVGEDVLPGFQFSLAELFARADQRRPGDE